MTLSLDMKIPIEEKMTNVTERRVTNVTEGRMTKRLSHYEKAAEKDLVTKLVNDINGVKGVNNLMTVEKPKQGNNESSYKEWEVIRWHYEEYSLIF